ncbi:hypothetical protein, partial [Sphingobium sp. IP1]|uniref:hypothetical protein n=1 Tax=Sphingobium sp. IP1 TaxID=2021637 RepID=UPI001C558D1C
GWVAECQLSWSQTGLRKVHTTSPKPIVVKHTAECKAHVQMVSGIEKDQQAAEVSSGSSIHGMSWKFISFTHANPRSGIALLERKARYLINALCINLVSHERSVTAIGRVAPDSFSGHKRTGRCGERFVRSALWTAIEGGKRPSHLRHAELVSASIKPNKPLVYWEEWTLKQVQGDDDGMGRCLVEACQSLRASS